LLTPGTVLAAASFQAISEGALSFSDESKVCLTARQLTLSSGKPLIVSTISLTETRLLHEKMRRGSLEVEIRDRLNFRRR
jgi:hypothetical protein